MAYIDIVDESQANGSLKADYTYLSDSYSAISGSRVPTPQVYTASSLVPAYFHFGAVQNEVLTNGGRHDLRQAGLPNILVNFGVSHASSCFY